MAAKKASKKAEAKPEPRIAAAVGIAVRSEDANLAQRLQDAMSQAVKEAMADGVSMDDADEMRRRMQVAKDAVLDG